MGQVHIAGLDVQIGAQLRQRCGWCGAVLVDVDLSTIAVAVHPDQPAAAPYPTWKVGSLVLVDGGLSMSVAHNDGDQMPPEACAQLPHDVTGARRGRTVGTGAPANWGCSMGDEGERQERD